MTANTNPIGPRILHAIAAQLGTRAPQELTGIFQDLFGSDIEQTFIGPGAALMRCCARWGAQVNAADSKRPVAGRVGGTENSFYRNSQSRREVHGAGVPADK